jgi:hypothetical protein
MDAWRYLPSLGAGHTPFPIDARSPPGFKRVRSGLPLPRLWAYSPPQRKTWLLRGEKP